jgi:hypothetical protein
MAFAQEGCDPWPGASSGSSDIVADTSFLPASLRTVKVVFGPTRTMTADS